MYLEEKKKKDAILLTHKLCKPPPYNVDYVSTYPIKN